MSWLDVLVVAIVWFLVLAVETWRSRRRTSNRISDRSATRDIAQRDHDRAEMRRQRRGPQ